MKIYITIEVNGGRVVFEDATSLPEVAEQVLDKGIKIAQVLEDEEEMKLNTQFDEQRYEDI